MMERYVLGFSRLRKDSIQKIEDMSSELISHLIKVFMWPNVEECNGWKQEIYSFMHSIPKMKPNNRYPKAQDIFKWIWEPYGDTIYDRIPVICRDIYETPQVMNNELIYNAIQEYMMWLSRELSVQGLVSRTDIYSKLGELTYRIYNS